MGAGTVPTVDPVAGTVVQPGETIVHDDPMGETIVHGDSLGGMSVHEDPLGETIPFDVPKSETAVSGIPAVPGTGSLLAFLEPDEMERLRKRWNEIQGTFVDEPRSAVQQADALVSDVIEKITQVVSNQHSSLESQWKQGTDISTEDLRKALQSYRTFFNRLVV
jgi:hypothetical protein